MRLILSHMRRCVEDYNMIQPGDKIAVGVSGGKDSLVLLYAMAKLRAFYPAPFELHAVTVHPGPEEMDFSAVAALCGELGVEYHLVPTEIFRIIFDVRKEKNPCSMCAKMRRGAIHNALQDLGITKIALGHHWDDAIETFSCPSSLRGGSTASSRSLIWTGRASPKFAPFCTPPRGRCEARWRATVCLW